MKQTEQSLKHYLALPYAIEISPIPKDDGGGYCARLPQFGVSGIIGDGETIEEALASLQEAKTVRFSRYLTEGLEIPEPAVEKEDYSGRFVVRPPKFLHRELVLSAKENGVSLNQYVCALLSAGTAVFGVSKELSQIGTDVQSIHDALSIMSYNIKGQIQSEVGKAFGEFNFDHFSNRAA